MASGGSPSLISLYTSSVRDLQSLEGIGPKRAEKIVELRSRGAFTMAELVVASGKPCVEWRGLFSVGRVEPLEEEGSMLSAPPLTPSPRRTPQAPTTVTAASFAPTEVTFREYLEGFSQQMLGEMSQVRRSIGDLDSRVTQVSQTVEALDSRMVQVSRTVEALDNRVVQVSRAVEDLDNRVKCQEEEAFRRSVSSGSPGGARGGRLVAAPPPLSQTRIRRVGECGQFPSPPRSPTPA